MNQLERDKQAIRTILTQKDGATSQEIWLAGGEEMLPALREMEQNGEVERIQKHSRAPILYRLK